MKKSSRSILFLFVVLACIVAIGLLIFSHSYKEKKNSILVEKNEEIQTQPVSSIAESNMYYAIEEQGYVVIYETNRNCIFLLTDICVNDLSEELQKEMKQGYYFTNEGELYDFLENHSS